MSVIEPFIGAQNKSLKSRIGKAHRNEAGFVPLLFYIDLVSCSFAKLFISSNRFFWGGVCSLEMFICRTTSPVNKNRFIYSFLDFFSGCLYFFPFIALARVSKTM